MKSITLSTVTPSETEVASMFSASREAPRDCMLLKLMYYFGLKTKEILKLTPGDFDFEFNVLTVRRGPRTRYLPIPRGFLEELSQYLENKPGSVPLFPVTDRHIRRIVKTYALKAQVRDAEKINPHSLREAYATMLRQSGMTGKDMQKLLGHARKETTDIYTKKGVLRKTE